MWIMKGLAGQIFKKIWPRGNQPKVKMSPPTPVIELTINQNPADPNVPNTIPKKNGFSRL